MVNSHYIKRNFSFIKNRVLNRFDSLKSQLELITKFAKDKDCKSIVPCIEMLTDFADIGIKATDEDFDYVIDSFDEPILSREDYDYKYILVTLRDNDYYKELDKLGDLIVNSFGEFEFDRIVESIPKLICSISSMCTANSHEDYINAYLKVLSSIDSIIAYIKNHELYFDNSSYENSVIKYDDRFKDVVSLEGNCELLLIRLAYNKKSGEYSEIMSDWCIY